MSCTLFTLKISRDPRVIYDVTGNAKILATVAQPKLSCVLVTISALYNTSIVVSFTADCKTTMLNDVSVPYCA